MSDKKRPGSHNIAVAPNELVSSPQTESPKGLPPTFSIGLVLPKGARS